jgi:NDP-sugar pyrophosphorylase family protein
MRMRPHTDRIPKILLPVAGQPFADLQLAWLAEHGVDHVILSIGHLGELVRQYVGRGERWGLEVDYCDDGDHPRGTGGALRLAIDEGLVGDRFLVIYGDSYLDVDVDAVWHRFSESGAAGLMTVIKNEGQWDTSNTDYADGWVRRYEKGVTSSRGGRLEFIDYGLLAFTAVAIEEAIAEGSGGDLATVLSHLALSGRLAGYEAHERFYEVGSPAGLRDLEAKLERRG